MVTISLDKKTLPEHHLRYEIDMLLFDTESLSQLKPWEKESEIMRANAFLESYLIHLRNIIYFLWNLGKNNDDIRADNFKPKGYPQNSISRESSKDNDKVAGFHPVCLKNKINKQISHLTSKRRYYKDSDKAWPTIKITCCISQYLIDYLNKCSMNEEYLKAMKSEISSFKDKYCNENRYIMSQNLTTISTTASSNVISFSVENNNH